MLKFKVAKLEDVEEAYRGVYSKGDDGAYYLQAEGAVAKEKLDEFRANNVNLLKTVEKFKDIDLEAYAKYLEESQAMKDKKLIEAGKVDELVESRVANMRKDYDSQLERQKNELQSASRQLETLLIDNSVRQVAAQIGVVPSAVDDLILRSKAVFKVKDGAPVAMDQNGGVIFGKDGSSSISIKDWATSLKDSAPHLFAQSHGSGSGGGSTRRGSESGKQMSAIQKIAQGLPD